MINQVLLDFLNIGGSEFMLIAVAILLLFGGKKLPELARGLGRGIREFNDASEGVKREIHRNINAVKADLTDEQEVAIQKNHMHPQEAALDSQEAAAANQVNAQTDTYIPADQLEVERVIAERLAQQDRINPEVESNTQTAEATQTNSAETKAVETPNTDNTEQSLKDSYK